MPPKANPRPINVYARWRPFVQAEEAAAAGEIDRSTNPAVGGQTSLLSVSINRQDRRAAGDRPWTSAPAFKAVLGPSDDNAKAYDTIVAPTVPSVLAGGSCTFFAYGHSGSGKTHTIMGYELEDEKSLGLCLAAARRLFDALRPLNEDAGGGAAQLGVGFSLFELRRKSAFDLLNRRTECFIREGPDGKTHIRGETEVLEGGKVRVQPIVKRPCWTFEALREELVRALGHRAVGSSSVHDQSSRTHAVLELEIVNSPLVEARQALAERQSELVPVGKRATDISIEESMKGVIKTDDGKWAPNPDYQINQALIDEADAEKAKFEARVTAAEEHIESILSSASSPCLGAKMVFVDLAGAEYHQEKGSQIQTFKQTPQERQEGRQINTDLLALKEVIRAWSTNQPRIPFRSSALTMVLREHFMNSAKGSSAMIVTVSPAREQYAATLNSLKYGSLVGAVGA
ncbi:uncharacterized protein E0L32_007624 [Thyridium curvatum]|uniref:Kinesin motor domain-containing protein n=1 Tax=Thyridium curvatum TaxID=1093900 RepID=A0A507ALX0_9PEZI|nr:uncharacterized protein E0L32_007624 [Thyridium curvatum]TPX11645.1 hypothetical protein E0L32_007624 [Thyridium curvatum]